MDLPSADNHLTEQEKKRIEDFSKLPEEIQKHLLTYGAGMLTSAKLAEATAQPA